MQNNWWFLRLISWLMLFCCERKYCTMADKFKRTG
jgi:hypothetical protein